MTTLALSPGKKSSSPEIPIADGNRQKISAVEVFPGKAVHSMRPLFPRPTRVDRVVESGSGETKDGGGTRVGWGQLFIRWS